MWTALRASHFKLQLIAEQHLMPVITSCKSSEGAFPKGHEVTRLERVWPPALACSM